MAEKHHSPLEQFEIHRVVELHLGHFDISITNSTLFLFGVVALMMIFFGVGLRNVSTVPSRFQSLIENLYEFIANTVQENIGTEGIKYLPFVFSLFVLILGMNLMGLLPYSFTVTSHIATTFALALLCFIIVNIIGFSRHGLHYFHIFAPEGIPIWMLPIISLIEVISYLIRPFSLGIRLAVAMSAGHIILKIFAGFVLTFVVVLGGYFAIAGIIPFAMVIGLIGLELLVSFIQAFIFAILVCIYLNDAVNMHSEF